MNMHQDVTVSFSEKRNATSQCTGREGRTGSYDLLQSMWKSKPVYGTVEGRRDDHIMGQEEGTKGLTTLESQHQVIKDTFGLTTLWV